MSDSEKYKELVEALRKKAAEILPKGSQMALYGSRARGDARPDSDWDLQILVEGAEKIPLDFWDQYGWPFEQVGWEHEEEVNPRVYSFSGWLKRSFLPFYRNVERDKVILFQN